MSRSDQIMKALEAAGERSCELSDADFSGTWSLEHDGLLFTLFSISAPHRHLETIVPYEVFAEHNDPDVLLHGMELFAMKTLMTHLAE